MFAMTEKGHGSNIRGIQTEATFDRDSQVRNLFPVSWISASGDGTDHRTFPEPFLTLCTCSGEKHRLRTASDCFRGGHEFRPSIAIAGNT